jgi:hypothetical protein
VAATALKNVEVHKNDSVKNIVQNDCGLFSSPFNHQKALQVALDQSFINYFCALNISLIWKWKSMVNFRTQFGIKEHHGKTNEMNGANFII